MTYGTLKDNESTPPEAKTSIQEKKTQLRGWDTVFSCVVESHA